MEKKIISFEVSAELKEALRVLAFHENTSVSALVRKILEKELFKRDCHG